MEPGPARSEPEPEPEFEFAWLLHLSKVKGIPVSEVRRYREEFRRLDANCNGELSVEEFKEHLRRECDLPKNEDIPQHLLDFNFRAADNNRDYSLTFQEFLDWAVKVAWVEERLVENAQERELRRLARATTLDLCQVEKAKRVYEAFDTNQTGVIEESEFRKAVTDVLHAKNPEDVSMKKLSRYWRELDTHCDGRISFQEFLPWYMSNFEDVQVIVPGSSKQQRNGTADGCPQTLSAVTPRPGRAPSKSASRGPPELGQHPSKLFGPVFGVRAHPAIEEASTENDMEDSSDIEGLGSLADRLARVHGSLTAKPFTEADAAVMQAAFGQFGIHHGQEMDRQDLPELLRRLGYVVASEAEVERHAASIFEYSALDFGDVLRFVESYARHEFKCLEAIFSRFAMDATGELPVQELRRLMSAIGCHPRQAAIKEALDAVDAGRAPSLKFDDILRFLVAYRHTEGFTREEVADLKRIFRSTSCDKGLLAPELVGGALTRMFGMQAKKYISTVLADPRLREGGFHGRGRCGSVHFEGGEDSCPLPFAAFVAAAGRLLRAMQRDNRSEFERLDLDGSGSLSVGELKVALQDLGYEPREPVIREVLEEVEFDGDGDLGLDEFLELVTLFDIRDGFLREELDEIECAFFGFDTDNSGTIDVTELGEALPHLGYAVSLDDLHLLTASVDAGSGGSLGLPEFRRLVRIQRDVELRKLRVAFDKFGEEERLPAAGIAEAMSMAIGGTAEDVEALSSFRHAAAGGDGVDFAAFVGMAEEGRAARASRLRRSAGFSPSEVEEFRRVFNSYDRDGRGQLNITEVQGVLEQLGMACRSRWDRMALLDQLDAARTNAEMAGAEATTDQGSSMIGFGDFLHLMRILRSHKFRTAEGNVSKAAEDLRFSTDEVVEFREAFIRLKRRREGSRRGSLRSEGSHRGSMRGGPCLPPSGGSPAAEDGISPADLYKLLRSLGLSISSAQREMLERQSSRMEATSTGLLSFVGFLRIMRWVLDSNFANINDAVGC